MCSLERNLFELEENDRDFQEICTKLKNHPFPSPWEVFYRSLDNSEFTTDVSEIIIEDLNLMKDNINTASLPFDNTPDVSKKDYSTKSAIDKKKVSKLREILMNAKEDSSVEVVTDFDVFFTVPSSHIPELIEMLSVSTMNDVSLNFLLNTFLHFKDQISIAIAISFVHHVICPLLIFDLPDSSRFNQKWYCWKTLVMRIKKSIELICPNIIVHKVLDIKKNSSRYLLTTIVKFAEVYPKAVIDEVLIPYTERDISDDLQSEIVSQIIKVNLPNEYITYGITRVLEHALPVDNSFAVLQCLVERKVCHENLLYDLLLKKLLSWTSGCNKNVKFTKLLTSILSAYGNEFTDQQILLCDEVVKNNRTIIKKAAENLLKKLKNEKL